MQWNRMLFALVVAFAVALAGCTQETDDTEDDGLGDGDEDLGNGDQNQFNTAEINFGANATGPVNQTVECQQGNPMLSISGEITNGTVNVTVMDANGTIVFAQNFSAGDNLTISDQAITGAPGNFTVTVAAVNATAEGDAAAEQDQATFEGEIDVLLRC